MSIDYGYALKLLLGTLASSFTLFKVIKAWYRKFQKQRDRKIQLQSDTDKRNQFIYEKLMKIDAQLSADSGKTVFDKVDNLVSSIDHIKSSLDELHDRQRFDLQIKNVPFFTCNNVFGNMDFVSPAFCKIVGRSESELQNKNWFSCLSTNDKRKVISEFMLSIEDKRTFDMEFCFTDTQDKEVRIYCIAYHSYSKSTGTYISTFGTIELLK